MSSSRITIIAEAGVNHNGDLNLAKQLIETAAAAGADYCKFQSFRAEELVSREAPKARYQKAAGGDEKQFSMLKGLELSDQEHPVLIEHCQRCGIQFLSTAFGPTSAKLLHQLNQKTWKIPSGELTNLPLLRFVGSVAERVILSTGMSDMDEIGRALSALTESRQPEIWLMQCTTQYPTPFEDINLRAMASLRQHFKLPVGISDHSEGVEIPIAAAALGAICIEKHFTLDRNLPGPDHKASLTPAELVSMIKGVRRVELALGDGIKRVMPSERENLAIARKSFHLAHARPAGHSLIEGDLALKRPGDGISSTELSQVVGRRLLKGVPGDHKLAWADLESC